MIKRFFICVLLCVSCFLVSSCSEMGGGQFQQAEVMPGQIHHVALLLPLQGVWGESGRDIRNGFFAAYYQEKALGHQPPAIQVIDTSAGNIVSLYQQAVEHGADVVVGPLTKTEVVTLANSGPISVPTLALNMPPEESHGSSNRLFYFPLSPLDEAAQVAQKAANDGANRALILAPGNAWGHSMVKSFQAQWAALGGVVVNTAYYGEQQSLAPAVRNLLHASDASSIPPAGATNPGDTNLGVAGHGGEMIFVIAKPVFARQILPLMKFYAAGNRLPVYATSHIYQGEPSAEQDRDLNGVYFCDMPWTLTPNALPADLAAIHQHVATLWPHENAQNPRLFALGVDAYRVLPELNRMSSQPNYGFTGASGMLYLNASHRLERHLMWAHIERGVPVPVN